MRIFVPQKDSSRSLVRQLSAFYDDHEGDPVFLEPDAISRVLFFIQEEDAGGEGFFASEAIIQEPKMTNREVLLRYYDCTDTDLETIEDIEDLEMEYFYMGPEGLDGEADLGNYFDTWLFADSPMAKAYKYFETLGIGQNEDPDRDLIEVKYLQGPSIPGGGSLKEIRCPDPFAASLIQARLIDLGEPTKIIAV